MKHDSLENWIRLAAFADRPASKPVAASPSYNFSEPRDGVEVAERLAIASEVRLPAVGTPARIKMDRAHNVMISGLLAVGRMRIWWPLNMLKITCRHCRRICAISRRVVGAEFVGIVACAQG